MDLRNILNTEGAAKAPAAPPATRSMSMSIPNDQFPPPPRMPPRAYSSINEISPMTHHDVLQSPLAPSVGSYGSPVFQRQSLPGHAPHSLRTSPEIQREALSSQTPTTARSARSSPDFPRDILNGASAPPPSFASPVERKSSTPIPPSSSEQRKRPSVMAMPPQSDQLRASPDVFAGQKRKADVPLESASQQKIRVDGPTKKRFTEVPIWATRAPLGRRRIVDAKVNGHTTHSLTPETKPPPPSLQQVPPEDKFEPNISGIPPYNNLVRLVSDFLWQNVIVQEPFDGSGPAKASWEIEAKLGTLIDRDTQSRFQNGSLTEAVLNPDIQNTRFESNLTLDQFKVLNNFLNDEVKRSRHPGRVPIEYNHPHELDSFYQLNQAGYQHLPPAAREYINPNHRSKLRVTTDFNTGAVKDKIVKTRINDIHIYCPANLFDIRISVSLEIKWDGPIEDFAEMRGENDRRDKNRLSYTHQAAQIDLTQVKGQTGLTHEAEIELDSTRLRQEADKIQNNGTAKYEDLVNMLIQNAIILNRAVEANMPPGIPPGAR